MNFNDYSSPLPQHLFSTTFFSKLLFGQSAKLQYPTIAPPGSVTSQNFSIEEPHSASSTLMTLLNVIPSVLDLLPTTSAMKDAYALGMRSVSVEFCVGMVSLYKGKIAFVHSDMCSIALYYRLDLLFLSVTTKIMWRACITSFIIFHHHNSLKLHQLLLYSNRCLFSLLCKVYRQMMYHYGDLLPFLWNTGWMKMFSMPSSKFHTLIIKQRYLFFLLTLLSLPVFFFQQAFFLMHEDTIKVNHSNTLPKSLIFNSADRTWKCTCTDVSIYLAIISAIFTKLLQLKWSETDTSIQYWDSDSVSTVADDEEPWCCVP